MFSDNLGFNPFDKGLNVSDPGCKKHRVEFLDSFHQKHIFCHNGDPRKKISSMNHTDMIDEILMANNNGSDAYFYVNGGRKLYAIKQFTCCFCDMDAGRDDQGSYFKPSVVMQKKREFLKKINQFPVPPSWVVDTRNGYQCYWLFDDTSRKIVGHNKTFWNGLQKKLVNYFGGDPRAIKANQIYRIPYTWWRKSWERKASYFTSILPGSTGQPINVTDLKSALTGQPATIQIIPEKCSDEWYKGWANAYKSADENGVPVSANVANEILQDLRNTNDHKCKTYSSLHTTGDSNPVVSVSAGTSVYAPAVDSENDLPEGDLNPDTQQTFLLKKVVEFLNQASTPLYFSKNQFLSRCAKELANEISDKFCIG